MGIRPLLLVSAIFLLLSGCGQTKPSRVIGLDNFPENLRPDVRAAIDSLNTHAGFTLLSTEAEGYPIEMKWVAATEAKSLGFAYTELAKCTIEVSDEIEALNSKELIQTVVWHEIGHCYGLDHDPAPGEIMYKNSQNFSNYSEEAVSRFLNRIFQSVNIH